MTQDYIVYLARESVYTIFVLAGPLLVVSIVVGLLISVFQATTQIQEQTLTFVPKFIAILSCLVILGPLMLNTVTSFARMIFEIIPRLGM